MVVAIRASRKPVKGLTSWSFSRWRAYDACPLQAKLSIIDKLPQPASPAMSRGDVIHKGIANYITGDARRMPNEATTFSELLNDLRKRYKRGSATIEETWAFRRDWSNTTWDDWNGCWLRVKVDASRRIDNHMDICDWKSGKFSPQYNLNDYTLQLELYSLAAFMRYADLETVSPHLVYVDHGIVHPEDAEVYTREDLGRLKAVWERRTKPMLSDRVFAPNPGPACRWCAFSKEKGGPCQF